MGVQMLDLSFARIKQNWNGRPDNWTWILLELNKTEKGVQILDLNFAGIK